MSAVLRFDTVEVHPTQRRLVVSGKDVAVGARAFDVLLALAEQPGELVTKRQLFARAWPGLIVEDNNLQVQVTALRKLLGAHAIATIPGLGYRLTLEHAETPLAPSADRADRAGAEHVEAHVPAEVPLQSGMLAPFIAPAGDEVLAKEAQRLTIDVTRMLGDSLRDVRLTSVDTATSIAAKASDVRVMGSAAKVRFVVEPELRGSGDEVVAILRLFDALDAHQLLVERYSASRDRLGEEHDAFVRRLTSVTRVMLQNAVAMARPEQDEAKATAQDLINKIPKLRIPDEAARFRETFRLANEAIQRDPKLATAWAIRAEMRVSFVWNDYDFKGDPEQTLAAADADSMQAVVLDDRDPFIWLARGRVLNARGYLEAALAANDKAQQLDPSRFGAVWARGWLYYVAGRHADALKIAESMPPHTVDLSVGLMCAAQLQMGDYDRAATSCERAAASADSWLFYANLAAAQAMRGDAVKAAQAKDKLLTVVPSFTISKYEAKRSFRDPDAIARDRQHMVAGLRKAGVPE